MSPLSSQRGLEAEAPGSDTFSPQDLRALRRWAVAELEHELRTPLSVLSGEVALIRSSPELTSDTVQRLDAAATALGRMRLLVEQLTVVGTWPDDPQPAPIRPGELVGSAVRLVQADAGAAEVEVVADIADHPPVKADRVRLEWALQQLVRHVAADLIDGAGSGGHLVISVRPSPQADEVVIEIIGHGGGEREPPTRWPASLRLAGRVVAAHGGHLTLEPGPAGSEAQRHDIRVVLPAATGSDGADPPVAGDGDSSGDGDSADSRAAAQLVFSGDGNSTSGDGDSTSSGDGETALSPVDVLFVAPSGTPSGDGSGPGDSPLVLVVEDDDLMRAHLHRVLSVDYRVVAVATAEAGLAAARQLAPDLIVSDIVLPGASGEHLVHRLATEDGSEAVPVVIVTGRTDEDVRVRLLRDGADDYVVKPFAVDELRARIANLLANRLGLDELRERADRAQLLAEQLQGALDSRVIIEQAKAFVAADRGIGIDEAFELLRRQARSSRRKLRDVAEEVVRQAEPK